ncbi:mfs multidrug transporter [Fusarium albosuccineum]|uniref:Mfs multidrug transporter n=1 Tax=Fusarium albosuccineum TaxID=1237068 RepID=A0A8H4KYU8_9HYPO|nr:mfs multidrug transporter [Fusarium albosuccineum]
MATCICSAVRLLAEQYDENRARELIPSLNCHLKDLRTVLAQSKSLTREVQYRITSINDRTSRAFFVDKIDLEPIYELYRRFGDNLEGVWTAPDNHVHPDLRRRLACVVVFLRSKLDSHMVPPQIARVFPGQKSFTDIRNSGRKYIKIARKLGGFGSILWLPLDIPPSTYERYLNIDDEEVFTHLKSLCPEAQDYTHAVQRLILSQLNEFAPSLTCHNLFVDYSEFVPASDQLLLLLYALGGSNIPNQLLQSVQFSQRRWNPEGEMEVLNAVDFGLPSDLVGLLSDSGKLEQAITNPHVTSHVLHDGSVTHSLSQELLTFFSQVLLGSTVDEIGATALRLLCFVCPPCYEGNTNWSASQKELVWPLLDRATNLYQVQSSLRKPVIESILYFCERDSVVIRRAAVEQAKRLLRKPMPYYLHASVVLFQSIIHRVDGDIAKSEAHIRDFEWRGPKPASRRDHALQGRLHISQIENKIKCYDNDVPSFIYRWEAEQPLSTLDIEVTFRLQSTAARYFQSIGDFSAARASLEQFLSLNTTKPIRSNSRRILIGRLADIYCEMHDFSKADEILQPELDAIHESDRSRRGFRRILLASVEANMGLGRLEASELVLRELEDATPFELDNVHDQQLHMRRLFAAARISHMRSDHQQALLRWRFALQEVERMHTPQSTSGFTAAVIHLSLAHIQLITGDRDSSRSSWATGSDILRREKCEFWIPVVSTTWLREVATEVHRLQGWSLRMMLPGGRPGITWP